MPLRRPFFYLPFLFLWLFSSPSFAGPYDPSLKWKTVQTAHFSIHFYEGEEELARKLAVITEEVYETLAGKFGKPWGRTEVVVVDQHDGANGFATVLPYNVIILRAVSPFAGSFLSDYDDWLRQLFAHEYTHIVHLSDVGYPAKLLKFAFGKIVAPNALTPGWVTEGLATYFESALTSRGRGRSPLTEMILRTDILNGRFLHLDQMNGRQYDWPSWLAQYLYGVEFWDYLSKTYGEESLIRFSHRYGASLRFFSLNSKAKQVFKKEGKGQSFYRLWNDWKISLEKQYAEVRREIEKAGLHEGAPFLQPKKGGSFSLPTWSPDGKSLAYLATSVHHPQELRLRDLEGGKERVLLKKRDIHQIAFSPDGKRLIVSNVGTWKRYYQYSDLHEIDLEMGKVKQLTKGKRARDPDVFVDGKIIAVLQGTGSSRLSILDPDKEEWRTLLEGGQFDHPRWLPDGRSVVVSRHLEGQRDLWIVGPKGAKKITSDLAVDDRPTVAATEQAIYFSSDRTGIPNIYRHDLKTGRTSQITNVLSGAFAPAISPDGKRVVFQYYNGRGFELKAMDLPHRPHPSLVTAVVTPLSRKGRGDMGASPLLTKDYNPFRRLFIPRYLLPNAALIDNAVFLSGRIGNTDPINRHLWYGGVTWRSDNNFFGLDGGYTYNRFLTPVFVGYSDFSVSYGDLFRTGADFFEERRRGFAGIGIPFSGQRLALNYFFEDRRAQSGLPAGRTLSTLGHYAGLYAQYSVGKIESTPAAISQERGQRMTAHFEISDRRLGSASQLQQQVVWGDARSYLLMPYAGHHVIALRAASGAAFGETFLQGNFSLGGSLGESPFVGASTRLFTLRGLPLATFSRDRAWVASAEYRFPLFRLQRGLGTLPISLNSGHFALFGDLGDAFNRGDLSLRPLLGVGGEFRGDFIVGYHVPVTGRLGYGVILTNRSRIAGTKDALTGNDARNGVLVLELGTSF